MQSLPSDMGDLLAVAEPAHSYVSDATSAFRLLRECKPSLLLFADADGEVVYMDDLGSGASMEIARTLAKRCVAELTGKPSCRLRVATDAGCQSAFVVRLPSWAETAIAACVVRSSPSLYESSLSDMDTSLVVCAGFGWATGHYRMIAGDLRTRVVHLQAEHHTLKNSQAQAVAAAIEEREKRLQQQRQGMAKLEAVMQLAADGIVTVNEDGIVESFNEAAGKIFCHDPSEVIGRHVSMLSPGPDGQRGHEDLAKYLNHGAPCIAGRSSELLGKRRDGNLFPLEIAVSEASLESGRVVTAIFRDITERRRLERQLVQAQKMESVGQLAAGIAHEINTPTQYVGDNTRFLEDAFQELTRLLAVCNELCEATEQGTFPGQLVAGVVAAAKEADLEYLIEEIPRAIAQSLEGVERVAKIVRSMKDFSHPGGETMQAVDVNRALESTLTVCRNEWKYVADEVTNLDPDLPLVTCLPGECNQVFLNLIINAAHAIGDKLSDTSAEKGTITVATRRDGDWAEIRIGDTGVGIPEGSRSRIFDPFFTTKPVGRGTGQGLAIAHSVVTEKHGGTINFESQIGCGTTFIVRLPICGKSPQRGVQGE
jgi:PAS domain S-box-containing protein